MTKGTNFDIIIIGGGLAGLTAALHLGKQDVKVLVIEKYKYPHHKVCGEYVSNEVTSYLQSLDVDPYKNGAIKINTLALSSINGKNVYTKLPLGGFGLSRYVFDEILYNKAKEKATFLFDTVVNVEFSSEMFSIQTLGKKTLKAPFVLGAYGKRSTIDKTLERTFITKKTPWIAIKAHYSYVMDENIVGLHAFKGGYCGLSKTETGQVNACYLTTTKEFKKYAGIVAFQKEHMSKNIHLKKFFSKATLTFEKPLAISQISFSNKKTVDNHIFMIGDTAGLIHPLCGNGMAMAIHSAKLFCDIYLKTKDSNIARTDLETAYKRIWNDTFSSRLKTGAFIQKILLHPSATKLGFRLAGIFPKLIPTLIKKTHGAPII